MTSGLTFNAHLDSLPVYQPGRPIEEVARELGLDADQISKLASNENPLGPSPKSLDAMRAVLPHLNLYPDGNAFYLKRKLAQKFGLESDNVILGNGSNEIIEFVGHALMGPGVEVVVSQYSFAVYPIVTHLFGATLLTVPARSYGHDLQAMLKAVTSRTKVMFVGNPNNPTGTVASPTELLDLARFLPDHVLLVLDEAYVEFLEQPVDLLPMIRAAKHRNILLLRTFSKIYGLAGLRLGYGLAHPDTIAIMEKVRQPFNINALVQAGATAALDDRRHIADTRANNQAGLRYFERQLVELGIEYVPSSANFILAKVGNGQSVFGELQQHGVIVRPMASYQLGEWIRITVGTTAQNVQCMTALKAVLKKTGPD